jgi:hypothetical protein
MRVQLLRRAEAAVDDTKTSVIAALGLAAAALLLAVVALVVGVRK